MTLSRLFQIRTIRTIMEVIESNTVKIDSGMEMIRNEISALKTICQGMRIEKLTQENKELTAEVEQAKNKLIQIERAKGIKQVALPAHLCTKVVEPSATETVENILTEPNKDKIVTEPKKDKVVEKAAKKDKEPKKKPEKKTEDKSDSLPVDVGRLDLRVGLIKDIQKHPDADALYVSKIECGDPDLRTVVSGLVKHVPIEELQGCKVIVLCNLKPVKMRGISSEAMVMCASTPDKVEVLIPPTNSEPGELVDCEGFVRQPDPQLNPKKKIFETVAPDLLTNDALQACYKGKLLKVTGKGEITSKTLKNVNIK